MNNQEAVVIRNKEIKIFLILTVNLSLRSKVCSKYELQLIFNTMDLSSHNSIDSKFIIIISTVNLTKLKKGMLSIKVDDAIATS